MLLEDDTTFDYPSQEHDVHPIRHAIHRQYSLPSSRRTSLFSFPAFRRQQSNPIKMREETEKMLCGDDHFGQDAFDEKIDFCKNGMLTEAASDRTPKQKAGGKIKLSTSTSSSRGRSQSEPMPNQGINFARKDWQSGAGIGASISFSAGKKAKSSGTGSWFDRLRTAERRDSAVSMSSEKEDEENEENEEEEDVDDNDSDDLAMVKPCGKAAVSTWMNSVQTQRMFGRSRWVAVGDDDS